MATEQVTLVDLQNAERPLAELLEKALAAKQGTVAAVVRVSLQALYNLHGEVRDRRETMAEIELTERIKAYRGWALDMLMLNFDTSEDALAALREIDPDVPVELLNPEDHWEAGYDPDPTG